MAQPQTPLHNYLVHLFCEAIVDDLRLHRPRTHSAYEYVRIVRQLRAKAVEEALQTQSTINGK